MKIVISFFVLFIIVGCTPKIDSDTTVLVKKYKGTPKAECDTIVSILESFYGVNVDVLENCDLYEKAFVSIKSSRYRADSIIKFQNNERNDTIDFIFGLTSKDISTTKKDASGNVKMPDNKYYDWGIMGLAYRPGKSCIVSTFRLQNKNKALYFTRLKKVAVHEFGHNLGLPHCQDKKCVMTDAVESIATIDNANLVLCNSCKRRLQ